MREERKAKRKEKIKFLRLSGPKAAVKAPKSKINISIELELTFYVGWSKVDQSGRANLANRPSSFVESSLFQLTDPDLLCGTSKGIQPYTQSS